MITLYGIPNCDTVKKARTWLETNQIEHTFHDFRKDGLTAETVASWIEQKSWEVIINKRSTSWRALPDDAKANMDANLAIQEAVKQPTLIKRPVLEGAGDLLVGFKEAEYSNHLS